MSEVSTVSHPSLFYGDLSTNCLQRLRDDHKNTLSNIECLRSMLCDNLSIKQNSRLIDALLKRIVDAPEDFHHLFERQIYRRAWFRSGRFLPRYIDLDGAHEKLRSYRGVLLKQIDCGLGAGKPNNEWITAIKQFLDGFAEQIRLEEGQLFPFFVRYLTEQDWREFDEANSAFEDVRSKLICGN